VLVVKFLNPAPTRTASGDYVRNSYFHAPSPCNPYTSRGLSLKGVVGGRRQRAARQISTLPYNSQQDLTTSRSACQTVLRALPPGTRRALVAAFS